MRSTYRPIYHPMANSAEDQRDGPLSRRDRNRRALALRDNLIFNPLRRPRDRLNQEIAERHRAGRFVNLFGQLGLTVSRARPGSSEPKLGREEKQIRCTIMVCHIP